MRLDIRLPLGFMFLTIGLILALYGLFGGLDGAKARINLRCGLALIAFGGGCLVLARRERRKS